MSINRLFAGFAGPFLLVSLALVTFPRTTEAAEKTRWRVDGTSLFAIFTSSSGSIYNIARVEAYQYISEGDLSGKQGYLAVYVQQFDASTSTQINGSGYTEDFVIEQKSNLRSARVQGTVTVYNQSSGPATFEVAIDVTWTGVGPLTRQSTRQHSNTFDSISMSSTTGITRSAEAIGSVTYGDINFTPGPSDPDYTYMGSGNDGTLLIIKLK
jgi:hypothetical protein